tara:strand:- start:622 stop:906 length:285 start_codon:yes stop_codon:yes gene_type:complete
MRQKPYLLKKDWVTGQDKLGNDVLLKVMDMIQGPERLKNESYEDFKIRRKAENGLVHDRFAGLLVPNEFDPVTGKIKPYINPTRQAKKARKLNG